MLERPDHPVSPLDGFPYVTAAINPVRDVIKQRNQDFLVEEIPRYQPCGEGEHIYLFIEKSGLSTTDVVRILTSHFNVQRKAIGYAGMKDKSAITRQVFSIHTPGKSFTDFPDLRHEQARVLWADMHTNKLRLGHLRGNRFSIRIRETDIQQVMQVRDVLELLHSRGVPNYVGEQRFGIRGNNHELGRLDILGDPQAMLDELLGPDERFPHLNHAARECYSRRDFVGTLDGLPPGARSEREVARALVRGANPAQAIRAVSREQRRFWVSSFQSWMFNKLLAQRILDDRLDSLSAGDVAYKHDSGAMFRVESGSAADAELAERLKTLAISPSGPIWGSKMMRAEGQTDENELAILQQEGVTLDHLEAATRRIGQFIEGTRRSFRVPLIDPEFEAGADEHGTYIRCAFELPPGSFATIVMREVFKHDDLEHRFESS